MSDQAFQMSQDQYASNILVIERLTKVEQQVDQLTGLLLPLVQDVHAIRISIKGRASFFAGIAATVSTIWIGVFAVLQLTGRL